MGYKPARKTYALTYVDYPGLEVLMHGTTIGRLEALGKLGANIASATPEQQMSVFRFFADKLIAWNVLHPEMEQVPDSNGVMYVPELCPACGLAEDDPLPADARAMGCLELEFITNVIKGWIETIGGASVPKVSNGSNGGMSTPTQTSQLGLLQSPLT